MADDVRPSAPMPSPPPPAPDHPHRRRTDSGVWVPDADDDGQRAVAWRARRGLSIAEEVREAIGKAPVPLEGRPGSGLWKILSDYVTESRAADARIEVLVNQVVAKLAAADALSEKRGGWVARVLWRSVDWLVPVALTALALILSGHLK